jgi:hypothetical protein
MAAEVLMINAKTGEKKLLFTVDAKELLRTQQGLTGKKLREQEERGVWQVAEPESQDLTERASEQTEAERHEAFKHKEGASTSGKAEKGPAKR